MASKLISSVAWVTGFYISQIPFPPPASAATQSAACQESIASTAAQITGAHNAPIVQVTISQIPGYYNSPFGNSNMRVVFALGSDDPYARTPKGKQEVGRIINFLESPQTQLALASGILNQCDGINAVEFAQSGSGHINTFFRMPSGKHQGAVLLPCDPAKYPGPVPWGFSKAC